MSSEVLNLALRIGSTAVLARMLLPEHFGLLAMVTAVTAFAAEVQGLGVVCRHGATG